MGRSGSPGSGIDRCAESLRDRKAKSSPWWQSMCHHVKISARRELWAHKPRDASRKSPECLFARRAHYRASLEVAGIVKAHDVRVNAPGERQMVSELIEWQYDKEGHEPLR
jgi:hypothetical protein